MSAFLAARKCGLAGARKRARARCGWGRRSCSPLATPRGAVGAGPSAAAGATRAQRQRGPAPSYPTTGAKRAISEWLAARGAGGGALTVTERWVGDTRPLAPWPSIRVVVRVRPVMDFERRRGDVPVVFPREDAPGVKVRGRQPAEPVPASPPPAAPARSQCRRGAVLEQELCIQRVFRPGRDTAELFRGMRGPGTPQLGDGRVSAHRAAASRRRSLTRASPNTTAIPRRCSRTGRRGRARRTA